MIAYLLLIAILLSLLATVAALLGTSLVFFYDRTSERLLKAACYLIIGAVLSSMWAVIAHLFQVWLSY